MAELEEFRIYLDSLESELNRTDSILELRKKNNSFKEGSLGK